jgi:hypothetical protein
VHALYSDVFFLPSFLHYSLLSVLRRLLSVITKASSSSLIHAQVVSVTCDVWNVKNVRKSDQSFIVF